MYMLMATEEARDEVKNHLIFGNKYGPESEWKGTSKENEKGPWIQEKQRISDIFSLSYQRKTKQFIVLKGIIVVFFGKS